jgi:methionyl aminopeptidase
MTITLKTAADVEGMRTACRLASEVLDMLTPHVKPGVTTEELDRLAHDLIVNVQGAVPAPPSRSAPRSTTRSATASRTTGR